MDQIIVDFGKALAPVKPMHCTNNGPVYKFTADQRITNVHHFKAAGIPTLAITTRPFAPPTAVSISWT